MFSSLKTKLAISHLGAIFCTVALLALITAWLGMRIYTKSTYDNLHRGSLLHSTTIQTFLAHKQTLLEKISESKETELYGKRYNDIALEAYFLHFKNEFSSLSYISPSGNEEVGIAHGKINNSLRDFSEDKQFKQAIEAPGIMVFGVQYSERGTPSPSASLVFTIAQKRYFDDKIVHILQASVPVTAIGKLLEKISQLWSDSVIVADDENTILIHPQKERLLTKLRLPDQESGLVNIEQFGMRGLYSSVIIPSVSWRIIDVLPFDRYLEAPMKYAALICLVVSCVLLVSFLIVLFVTRRINTPLTDLTKAAKRIASGEEIELLQPYDIEELDNLVEAFDTMFFELRETTISKDYLNRIVDSLRECLLVTSLNGTIESSNRTALNLLGCTEEQLIGRHISTLFPEEFDIDAYPVGSEQHGEIETAFITFRGEKIPIVFFRSFIKSKEGDNLGIACLALDIRVRKKIEEEKESLKAQLYNAQRLETVGTLASGIAHDFNNILTIIIGYTQILQFTIKNAASAEPLKQILSASHRAKDLVQQLLEFSRQGSHPKMEISLVSIVKEIVKMLKSSTPASIEISQKVNPDCRTIVADPGQIQQIIMNLSSNAIHAMKDYGTLTIKLDNELINKLNADQYPGAPEERFVKLMVCDTGHGIQKKDIAHIFDPFFTTKTVDKGTGLGLSVVHGMIKSLQGHIFVKSEEGEGTTFTILLPATLDKDTTQEDSPLSAANHKLLQGSGERILFVDDEEALTKLEKINLESLGYRVTCTTSSQEALEFFRQEPTQFDLLITDFSMPKMRGDKLLQEIRRIRSDMPAILCTGYHAKLVPAEKINGAFRTIKKPYTNENMAKEVKEILASRGRE